MDIKDIKQLAIALRASLKAYGICADCIVLFGSHAKNLAGPHSDIDLAVISRDFGKDRFQEGSLLSRVAVKVHPDIEALPIGLKDFLAPAPISPILSEIKTSGTILI
jgi:predicted nucleotidyltransferase